MFALGLVLLSQASPITMNYNGWDGLSLRVRDIPIIQGSAIQYYEGGWVAGVYSSRFNPQTIRRKDGGVIDVRFTSLEGRVSGSEVYTPTENGYRAELEYFWGGDRAVYLEKALGYLWAPAFSEGTLSVDGGSPIRLDQVPRPGAPIAQRTLAEGVGRLVFEAPIGRVEIKVDPPVARIFDARNKDQFYAQDREVFWLGLVDQRLEPNARLRFTVEMSIDLNIPVPTGEVPTLTPAFRRGSDVLVGKVEPIPVLPKPKEMSDPAGHVRLGSSFRFELPNEARAWGAETEATVRRLWQWPATGSPTRVVGSVRDLGLPAEGYTLKVDARGVQVTGQDLPGLRNGLRTLAFLPRPHNGGLALPKTSIRDWPSIPWRGVHLFVGPRALEFQSKLMDRVLAPLKFNHVVSQCERTDWKATPGIQTGMTMSREDLVALFERYRSKGIEPIPLIQSLGHIGWLFANDQNLNLAFNPEEPFQIDPRKPEARQKVVSIWEEAIPLLRPRTVHFGLDEIDMRGMPHNPDMTTEFWRTMLPDLFALARRHNVQPMMWSDIMLDRNEAVDATHGQGQGQIRRDVLEEGTWIADWHYRGNPDPEVFLPSLRLWVREGMRPIASAWYEPNNIRGFALATAQVPNAGFLQTTWAGFESNERNMLLAVHQFSAMILAADYAWSARQEMPDDLPYSASMLFRRLYMGKPMAVGSVQGYQAVMGLDEPRRVGGIEFRDLGPVVLNSYVSTAARHAPESVKININRRGAELALLVDCLAHTWNGDHVADVLVETASGTVTVPIRYGSEVRSASDLRETGLALREDGMSVIRVDLGDQPVQVQSLTLIRRSPVAGLRLHGVSLL